MQVWWSGLSKSLPAPTPPEIRTPTIPSVHPIPQRPTQTSPDLDIFLDVCAPKLVYGAIDTLNAKPRVEYMYKEMPEIGASWSAGLKGVAGVPIQNRDANRQTEYGLSNVQWQKLIVKSPTCHD